MKRSNWMVLGAVAAATLALAAIPAAAQNFPAGDDAFNTASGGSTTVDVSQFPGALQALGGATIDGGNVINLQGVTLNSSFGPSVDSIVARGAITNGGGSLTLAALDMVSSSNLVLSDGRQYQLDVCLSDTAPTTGTITLSQVDNNGGTFSSSFKVIPKLVFINVNNPNDVITIDCAVAGCNLTISSSGTGYALTGGSNQFNPSTEGINVLPTGNQTVANCNSTHTVNIVAPGSFYPGWTFAPSGGAQPHGVFHSTGVTDVARQQPQAASGTWKPAPNNDSHAGAIHKTNPPQDCLSGRQPGSVGPTPGLAVHYCAVQIQQTGF